MEVMWELRDGTQRISVERDVFLKAWSTSIDRVYLVLFQVGGPKVEETPMQPNVKERRRLFELQAAAGQVALYADSDAEFGEDESFCCAGDRVLELMQSEVEAVLAKRVRPTQTARGAMLVCPLCPFRGFSICNPKRLYGHVQKYHVAPKQYCPSGAKQVKMVISIYDTDRLLGHEERPNLLQRSAAFMRKTVQPPLDHSRNNIDRRIRLVLTGNGPEYWNLEAVQQAALRRARNLYYSIDFAQLLFQQTLIQNAKAGLLKLSVMVFSTP